MDDELAISQVQIAQEWISFPWWLPGLHFLTQGCSILWACMKIREQVNRVYSKARSSLATVSSPYFCWACKEFLSNIKLPILPILCGWQISSYRNGQTLVNRPCLPHLLFLSYLPHSPLNGSTGPSLLRWQVSLLGGASILNPFLPPCTGEHKQKNFEGNQRTVIIFLKLRVQDFLLFLWDFLSSSMVFLSSPDWKVSSKQKVLIVQNWEEQSLTKTPRFINPQILQSLTLKDFEWKRALKIW
jgi:hypothetical protein